MRSATATRRVFAAGESSGGDFSGILGCEYAAVLRAVVPCSTKNVSQYPLDATKRKCTGQVTPIVMQGKNDNVVGPENGPKMRDFYLALNHCGTTTVPVQGYTDTLSNCVQYQGCDAGFPVYWCNHTDPNYSNVIANWLSTNVQDNDTAGVAIALSGALRVFEQASQLKVQRVMLGSCSLAGGRRRRPVRLPPLAACRSAAHAAAIRRR